MLGICLMLNSCYHRHNSHQQHAAMLEYSDRQLDSISFSTTHHYTNKYNFMVFKDSIHLMRQQPEELVSGLSVDSFSVKKNQLLVVTDIRMHPLLFGLLCKTRRQEAAMEGASVPGVGRWQKIPPGIQLCRVPDECL